MREQRQENRAARRRERLGLSLLKIPFQQITNRWPPLAILAPEQLERLHLASMSILENTGLDFLDDEALEIWARAGAKVDRKERHVWIDRGLLQEAVSKAPATFTWRARNPAHDVHIGGNRIHFAPQGGVAYVTDLANGRRNGTMADYHNFLKLNQVSGVIHFAGEQLIVPTDVPVSQRHLRRLLAAITLTDKALNEAAHGRIITNDGINMAKILFGENLGQAADDDEPVAVVGGVINASSPLRYDDRMLGGLINLARHGQVTVITPFILAGAMSPITIAAALAQQNAEALAGIALAQLVRPGAPVLYGGFTTNVDMKSGSPAFGTPEAAWAMAAGAQLARFYNLPYRGSGSLNTAKVADAQAAYETMWTIWPAVMAHTNLVMHAVGWLEGGLTVSYEKIMIDLENLAMFAHFLKGFDVNDDTLALDMIAAVGASGHHFGTPHTQARFSTEFYETSLADRLGFETWQAAGAWDTARRAQELWPAMLTAYEQPAIDPAIAEALADYVARREREVERQDLYA
jgi:trimethylamine---corrinoid protein Co-methyltransferase